MVTLAPLYEIERGTEQFVSTSCEAGWPLLKDGAVRVPFTGARGLIYESGRVRRRIPGGV
jgi:hypothetical protein